MTKFSPIFEGDDPLYIQIADQIERGVRAGNLADGELLPSIRDLAVRTGINMSTVTRAYREAERRGIVAGTTGSGTYVTGLDIARSSMASPEPYSRGMIEMGIVSPLSYLDPDLSSALRAVSRRRNLSSFLRYHAPEGSVSHREAGRIWMKKYGADYSADDICVCAGSQHALSCVLLSHFREGDRIAADALTYPGFKTCAAMLKIKCIPVAMDGSGMIPDELDAVCRREHIKGVYLMPSMQNPTASSMDETRRDAIAETAARHGLLVIEDDAYIHSADKPGVPMAVRLPDRTVYIAGMSKAMGAGLRISFAAASRDSRIKIAQAIVNTVWMTPPLNAEIMSGWIRDGSAERTIAAKMKEARVRNRIARRVFGDTAYGSSAHGHYIWLPMREGVSAKKFEYSMRIKGINLFAAEKFAVGNYISDNAVRISLTTVESREELTRALEQISAVRG